LISEIPNILLVNPWIYDFAAYDYWAKPLGLLYLASILRELGCRVAYIDCLNRFHPDTKKHASSKPDGRGSYPKTFIPKPDGLADIPRNYSRYGISYELFKKDLSLVPKPDLIFVTSHMTYWYPGLFDTISVIKETFPSAPVLLGGTYATLCHDHAVKYSGADRVFTGPGEGLVSEIVKEYTGYNPGIKFDPKNLDSYPYPAFDLETKIAFIPILTSRGCPFSCTYCASSFLAPERMKRSPESVVNEIVHWHKNFRVKDFAIYDDAFLVDSQNHAVPILEGIIGAGIKAGFYTPNALHIREITKRTADLMFKAGFRTVRLGLETALFENRSDLDVKVTEAEFMKSVSFLKEAGFSGKQVGAYLLVGLPDQDTASIMESVKKVKEMGITPVPAYYSPIPHTVLWENAVHSSRYDIMSDPIFTNNAIFPCSRDNFSWKLISALKKLAEE
jgi:radical SAM superfamily enzyme YgiQ (UPF0313 family)